MLALAPERPEGRLALGNYYLNVRNDTRRGARAVYPRAADGALIPSTRSSRRGRRSKPRALEAAFEHSGRGYKCSTPLSDAGRSHSRITLSLLRRYRRGGQRRRSRPDSRADCAGMVQIKAMIYLARGDLPGARRWSEEPSAGGAGDPCDRCSDGTGTSTGCSRSRSSSCCSGSRRARTTTTAPPGAWCWPRPMRSGVTRRERGSTPTRPDSRLKSSSGGRPRTPSSTRSTGWRWPTWAARAEAVREGEQRRSARAARRTGVPNGTYVRHQLVRIYLLVGEPEKAVDQLGAAAQDPLLSLTRLAQDRPDIRSTPWPSALPAALGSDGLRAWLKLRGSHPSNGAAYGAVNTV